ncbi:MAG: DUF3726 domain-containing protein [Pseudomonadota bacterium]
MQLSLSEIDALGRKAMRGAGASWGLAEEAGKAVRWLVARSHPGADALARLLENWPGQEVAGSSGTGWSGPTGRLCPIRAGTVIQDHAGLVGDQPVRLNRIIEPLLLQPFAVANGFSIETLDAMGNVVLVRRNVQVPPASSMTCPISQDVLQRLEMWAQQTYVPATEASRAGAGSDRSDND